MENKFYTDDIERLLKEKSDEFRMYPSRRVWHSIYNDRHPSRKWPSIAISMILVFILLSVGYLNTSDTDLPKSLLLAESTDSNTSEPVAANYKDSKRWKTAERKAYVTISDDDQAPTADAASEDAAATTFIALGPPVFSVTDEAMTQEPANNSITSFNQNNNTSNYLSTGIDAAASGSFSNKSETVVRNNNATPGQRNSMNPATATNRTPAASTPSVTGSNAGNNNTLIAANNNNRVRRNTNSPADENTVAANSGNNRRKPIAKRGTTNGKETSEEDLAVTADPNKKATTSTKSQLLTSTGNNAADAKKAADNPASLLANVGKSGLSDEEKGWIDDFALYNKSPRKKWKDVVSMEFYATPSMSYRSMSSNIKQPSASPFANNEISKYAQHKPGIGIEAGVGVAYAFAKRLRFKAGVQFNYTNFGINAGENSHPSLVSLLMNDPKTGYAYSSSRSTSLTNVTEDGRPITLNNRTYQVSVPLGLAFKLAGNKKMEWFAGATIQPSYVFGGNAYLLSADLKNYVGDPTAIRRWNFNTGIETYLNYKVGKTTSFQVGPQLRYQLQSTFKNDFTTSEKLYNVGLKLGLVKNF